jgi:hypothetical protein
MSTLPDVFMVRPTWALKPGLTDRLVVGHNVTLILTVGS